MAPMLGTRGGEGLERSCRPGEWMRGHVPAPGVELLQARFAGRAFSRHRHDTYAIGVTEAGVQVFDYRGQVERSLPGQVTVLHPDEAHDGRAGGEGGFGYRIVYVEPARIADAVRAIRGRPAPLPFVREPVSHNPTLARAVAAGFAAPPEPLAFDTVLVGLAEGLIEGGGGHPTGHATSLPCRVDEVAVGRGRALLDDRHTVVRSSEVEAVTGLSRYEFARQFRALYGTSPYRYSLMRRLDVARAWLRDGVPLADLSLTVGFADQAHFTRMFRSAYGITPGRYARLSAEVPTWSRLSTRPNRSSGTPAGSA